MAAICRKNERGKSQTNIFGRQCPRSLAIQGSVSIGRLLSTVSSVRPLTTHYLRESWRFRIQAPVCSNMIPEQSA